MKRPPVGLLACAGALLLSLASDAKAQARTVQEVPTTLNWQAGRAPQKAPAKPAAKASNAPGTSAPVYNEQRAGSVDPEVVAARYTPTLAAPLEPAAKPTAVQPAAYTNQPRQLAEPRYLDQSRRDDRVSPAQYPELIDDPTMFDEGPGGCATCGPSGCGDRCGGGLSDCVPCNYFALNGWYLGADYVNARANFSDPAAILVRSVSNGGLNFHDETVPYETGYQSTYRLSAGYRWGACGESINFSYFGFSDNTYVDTPEINANVVAAGPFALNCNPGEHLRTGLDVQADVYDLNYSKRIPLCTSNCDPCSCGGGCPPWAITWSAGIRFGRLDLTSPTQLFDVNGALVNDALSEVTFSGAGPRIAIEGRRYLGDCARWSVYSKGSMSLLLGQYDVEQQLLDLRTNALARQEFHYTRIVPVLDIEIGLSRQLGKKTLLTAGYFMQCWIDASTVNNLNQPGVGQLSPANVDDANMTMFDGFMLRLERVF